MRSLRPFGIALLVPFIASSSLAQTRALGPNQPPEWVEGSDEETTSTGGYLVINVRANDPDKHPVSYRIEALPAGARVEWTEDILERYDGAELRVHHPSIVWEPREDQAGRHEIRVSASDGSHTITKTVRVSVEEEWETFLMPGLSYTAYQPVDSAFGTFHGPSAELLIAGWIHRNENRGPSHVRIYSTIGLLSSTKNDVDKAVIPALGFDLSIERNPRRSFLVPYFGLEGGLIAQEAIGAPGYVFPFLGGHLWSSRNLFVNLSGGYVFPMHNVDVARGYVGRLSLNFSLW